MNLFGKKKKAAPAPTTSDTILKLRNTIETLEKREQYIEIKVAQQTKEAKEKLKKKDKKGAMYCLKRKKMYEKELEKLSGAKLTLDQQIITLEGAHINNTTFQATRDVANVLKHQRGNLDVDDVEEALEDVREEMDFASEIGDAIARPAQELFDDDELLDELNELEELGVEEELLEAPAVPAGQPVAVAAPAPVPASAPAVTDADLPAAPTGPVETTIQGDVDADDLAALRALEAELAV